MRYIDERLAIIAACLEMQERHFFIGTWGNISVRIDDHILLTPSKVCYNTMQPEDLVVIDMDGRIVEGNRPPTSEKEVHRQIYCRRPDLRAIIHAHTPHAMALGCSMHREVPCICEEMSQLLGGAIPISARYVPAGEHEALGRMAADTIGQRNGLILTNHGSVGCGRNLQEASLAVEVLEKSCTIYLSAHQLGQVFPIPQPDIASEHYRYFHTYGKENT